jgi:hypothetical protein
VVLGCSITGAIKGAALLPQLVAVARKTNVLGHFLFVLDNQLPQQKAGLYYM